MKRSTDVTEEYIKRATPKTGKIVYEEGYITNQHNEEVSMAEWMHVHLGGDIKLLKEMDGFYGAKRSDYEWRGKLWELKTLKSEKSVDSAVRKAIGQIYDNPGGVILNFGKNPVTMSRIEAAVKSRIESSCRFKVDIMIVYAGKLQKVIRYT